MTITQKLLSDLDSNQVERFAYNPEQATIGVDGFIVGKVGHKITKTDVDLVTEDYKYYDGSNLLLTIRIIYTDNTKENLASVERIA